MSQDGEVASRLASSSSCTRLADAVLVEHALDQATPEQLLGVAPGLFGELHGGTGVGLGAELPGRFFGQPPLVFRRQDLAGDRRGGLDHQAAHLALEFGQHAGVVLGGGLARLVIICSAAAMAFWVSCSCTRAAAARASSISLVACALAWTMTSWRWASRPGQFLL